MKNLKPYDINNISTTAAFMVLGLIDNKYDGFTSDDIVASWGQGFLELVSELVRNAEHSEMLLATRATDEFPGVYDYEVSEPFGKWFGAYVFEHGGQLPPIEECNAELIRRINAFFNQCYTKEEVSKS